MAFWMQGHQHKSNNMGHQSKSNSLILSYQQGQNTYICSAPKFLSEGGHKVAFKITVQKSHIKHVLSAPIIKSGTECALKLQKKKDTEFQKIGAKSLVRIKQRKGWHTELNELDRLKQYCNKWNQIAIKPVMTNDSCVLKVEHTFKSANLTLEKGEYVFIEPLLPSFDKFNHPAHGISTMAKHCKNGNKDDYALSIQAFCHYTYHVSGGRELVCDAQGHRDSQCYILTDPYYLSDGEKIKLWFDKHKCNSFCCQRVINHPYHGATRVQEPWLFPKDAEHTQLHPFIEHNLRIQNAHNNKIWPTV